MIDNAKIVARILKKHGQIISKDEMIQLLEAAGDPSALASAIMELGPPFNVREAQVLSSVVGDMNDGTSFERDGDLWRDDILDKYAQFVHNYEYQYNDKAHEVDPSIDLNEVHVGPMAQDLEKVNPAVVKEDESGYKTVDTGRLALMNAGAIADLARQVESLKNGG